MHFATSNHTGIQFWPHIENNLNQMYFKYFYDSLQRHQDRSRGAKCDTEVARSAGDKSELVLN